MQALTDVDFEVRNGEVMALVGDNGAGKSTLIKCVAGIHPMDDGEIIFDGQPVSISSPKDAAKLGIEVVYQDLALCDNLDVVQNMYLGREAHDWFQRLKEPPMEAKTSETLKTLAVTTIRSIRQPVATLSGGQRQSVAVARAVMWNSRLVILDEPTAALGVAQTEQVLELVKRLAEQGLARRPDLPQPARHLRGRRPHHRAPPRPQHRHLRAQRDDAGGGRARDHRRRADEGLGDPRHRPRGARMTTEASPPPRRRRRSRATASASAPTSARGTSAARRSSSRS